LAVLAGGSHPKEENNHMQLTRRDFVKTTAIGAAGIMAYKGGLRSAFAYANSKALQKFVWPMPMFGAGIPLAQTAPNPPYAGVDYYQLTAGVFRQQLHPQLPPTGTRLYGYADHRGNYKHLGGAVLANQGRPVRFTFTSALPPSHILPFDATVPTQANGGSRQDRAAVHLHGGLVPWCCDGGPFHWQCPDPTVTGSSVTPWLWDGQKNVWDYYYPNLQSARLMWYHDHAIGITRLNAYAGAATGYVLTDAVEAALNLPFGDPIVFQDKVFWDSANDIAYGNHVSGVADGDLWYPYFYDPAIWPIAKGGQPPTPSAIPEFFGDTMLANGIVYPFHNVGVGKYRFRLLNACNARFLDLSFVVENGTSGEPLLLKNGKPVAANVDVWQIGTEGGFLPSPVPLITGGVPNQPFILGPAERADIIIDFKATGNVILYNVAGSPFPGGAPIFDWYLGNKKTPALTTAGNGPNTRTIMRFVVSGGSPNTITIPTSIPVTSIPTVPDIVNGGLMVNPASLNTGGTIYTDPLTGAQFGYDPIPVELTLNEVVEPLNFAQGTVPNTGRLLTLIGNRANPTAQPFGPGGIFYFEPPTESVQYNTLRIWKIYNFTADAHPMHFHLFNVQILGRQRVDKTFLPKAPAVPPLPSELGFKETVIMYPGEVTIVAALVEDPLPASTYPREAVTNRPQIPVTLATGGQTVLSTVPFSPRLQAAPYNINVDEYVWHCHILEHEEHDMMRPLTAS
jgi:spore coat protein A, manganese oxidase